MRIPREPAVWVGLIGSGLAVAAATGIPHVTAGVATAGTTLAAAVVIAVFTRPVTPALFVGVFSALAALVAEFGLHWSDAAVGSIGGFILAAFAFFGVRPQVDPTDRHGKVIEGVVVQNASVPR